MNKLTEPEFEDALVEVRKAYRILYIYQKRVLDLIRFCGDTLSFQYEGGWPKFSNSSPKEGKGNLESWAWDWLNMYLYEFHFKEREVGHTNLQLSILLVSDTGFFDTSMTGGSKGTLSTFNNVKNSSTKVIFVIGKGYWDFDLVVKDEYIRENIGTTIIKTDGSKVFLAKSYKLSSFINEGKARNALDDFQAFCSQHNLPNFIKSENKF